MTAATLRLPVLELTSGQQETVKWLAVAAMVIDHIGAVLLPELVELRFIGRVAFPLFAFLIAYNISRRGVHETRYLGPLAVLLVVSHLPHQLALGGSQLNIFGTLLAGVVLHLCLHSGFRHEYQRWLFLALAVVLAASSEYGPLGVALVTMLCIVLRTRDPLSWGLSVVLIAAVNGSPAYGLAALASVPLVLLIATLPLDVPRMPRWFWYAFYPSHLGALWLLTVLP